MNLSSVLLTTVHWRVCVRPSVSGVYRNGIADNIPRASIAAADFGDVRQVSIVYFVIRAKLQVSTLEARWTLTKCQQFMAKISQPARLYGVPI